MTKSFNHKDVISSLMMNLSLFEEGQSTAYKLSTDIFETEEHQKLYETCKKYRELGFSKISREILVEEGLEGSLAEEYVVSNPNDTFKLAYRNYVQDEDEKAFKNTITAISEQTDMLKTIPLEKRDEIKQKVMEQIMDLPGVSSEFKPVAIEKSYEKRSRKEQNTKRVPMYIGMHETEDGSFRDFDSYIGGGLIKGDTHAIVGYSGEGKTAKALFSAVRQAEQGYKILFISLEMTEEQIQNRTLAILKGNSPRDWEEMDTKEEKDFLVDKKLGKTILSAYFEGRFEIYHYSPTMDEFKKHMKEHVLNKYDVVYMDNVQYLPYDSKKDRTAQYDALSNDITTMFKGSTTAFVWLSQITQKGTDFKDFNYKYSNKLFNDISTSFFVYRPDKHVKKKDNDELEVVNIDQMAIDIVKNRHDGEEPKNMFYAFNQVNNRIGSFVFDNVEIRISQNKERDEKIKQIEEEARKKEELTKGYMVNNKVDPLEDPFATIENVEISI